MSRPTNTTSKPTLLSLPAEIHAMILPSLTYPDVLALKHTHPHFLITVHPTTYDRIQWLLERANVGLPIPQTKKCVFKSDEQFCSNAEVQTIMRRRRAHLECAVMRRSGRGKDGCMVIEGRRCERFDSKMYRREVFRGALWDVVTELRRSAFEHRIAILSLLYGLLLSYFVVAYLHVGGVPAGSAMLAVVAGP